MAEPAPIAQPKMPKGLPSARIADLRGVDPADDQGRGAEGELVCVYHCGGGGAP